MRTNILLLLWISATLIPGLSLAVWLWLELVRSWIGDDFTAALTFGGICVAVTLAVTGYLAAKNCLRQRSDATDC